jgi:hypothetical protein
VVQDADAARHLYRAASIPPEPAAQRARIVAAIRQLAPTSQPRAPTHVEDRARQAHNLHAHATGANCGKNKANLRHYVALTCCSSHASSHEQPEPRSGERRREAAQRRTTYTSTTNQTPATICRIDMMLASCIKQPEARAGLRHYVAPIDLTIVIG